MNALTKRIIETVEKLDDDQQAAVLAYAATGNEPYALIEAEEAAIARGDADIKPLPTGVGRFV